MMETLGYEPLCVATARNKVERGERLADWAYWFGLGVTLPLLLERHAARPISNQLRRQFGLALQQGKQATETSLLHIPLQWVDAAKQGTAHITPEALQRTAQQLQLDRATLEKLLTRPEFKQALAKAKTQLMAIDMGMLALKGHVFFGTKNLLSKHFSGKSGFVGEFNYTDESFRKDTSKTFEASAKRRWAFGAGVGALLSAGLPALVYTVNQAKKNPTTGIHALLHHLKPFTKWFEYTEATYMPRLVVFMTDLANYTLPMLVASRDKHELRESFVRALAFDGFYFVGNGAINTVVGKALQRGLKPGVSILEHHAHMPRWVATQPKSLATVYREVGEILHTNDAKKITQHPAYKAANQAMWTGILASGVALGGAIPLINNWLTYKLVKQQTHTQEEPQGKAQTTTPLPLQGTQPPAPENMASKAPSKIPTPPSASNASDDAFHGHKPSFPKASSAFVPVFAFAPPLLFGHTPDLVTPVVPRAGFNATPNPFARTTTMASSAL